VEQTESILIDRPAGDVWPLVGDVRGWNQWLTGISDVELVSDELAPGSEFSYQYRHKPVRATVDQYEEGRLIGISTSEKRYDFAESITLDPRGDQTEVTFTMGFEPTVWWASALSVLLIPVKGLMLGRPLRQELQDLKVAVEGGAGSE
jgi:uncharacterized membrane protein